MTSWNWTRATRTAMAAIAVGALMLAGCSDNDDDDGGGGNGGGGSDEEYVASLCGALNTFADDSNEILADAGTSPDQEQLFEDLSGVIRDLAGTLDDADPPDDLAASNDDLVALLNGAADSVAEGDITAAAALGAPDFELSEERIAELRAIADDNESCGELQEKGLGDLFQ